MPARVVVEAATTAGDWIGPVAQIAVPVIAVATLILTRVPDYSRLRRIERLTAVVKDLPEGTAARIATQGILDEQTQKLAERLGPRRATERRVLNLASVLAVLTLATSVAVVVATVVALASPTQPQQPALSMPDVVATLSVTATGAATVVALAIAAISAVSAARGRRRELLADRYKSNT